MRRSPPLCTRLPLGEPDITHSGQLESGTSVVEHVKGVNIIAGPLTKDLAKNKLREAYDKLQMGPNGEDV